MSDFQIVCENYLQHLQPNEQTKTHPYAHPKALTKPEFESTLSKQLDVDKKIHTLDLHLQI